MDSERFTRLEKKLQEHDKRFDEHDKRFDAIDKRLDEHDKRFDAIDKKLLHHEHRLDALTEEVVELREDVDTGFREIKAGLARIEKQSAVLINVVTKLAADVEDTKKLEGRVARLEAAVFGTRR